MRIIEGKANIISGFLTYLQDESKLSFGDVEYLAFPENEKDVCEFLKFCSDKNLPVTVSNGKTGVVGGAVPVAGALMSLEKFNKIFGVKSVNGEYLVRLESGVSLDEFYKFLENENFSGGKYFYPVDVTESTAKIGGTVSTNASGERSFKYGPTRNWVRSLRVVLSDGNVLSIERGKIFADDYYLEIKLPDGSIKKIKIPQYKMPSVKNAAGYYVKKNMDLIDLFIGSEGTLGVITEVELALTKKPENIMTLLAFFPQEQNAMNFFFECKKNLKSAVVFEYFDKGAMELLKPKMADLPSDKNAAIFFEIEYTDEDLEKISSDIELLLKKNGSSMDNTWGGFEKKDIEKIRQIRHAIPETINETLARTKQKYPAIHKISADIAVPALKFSEMISYYKSELEPLKLRYTLFGHIGENHLHMNILPRNNEEFLKAKELHLDFAEKAVSLGGTVSAEHGIGKIKHQYLEIMYGKEGIKQMAAVKKVLDPKGILNRGNIFNEEYLNA
ncbi:MAG TPA: FAD-binding oxidoreductase [Elusimicrobia bacterium]|nr:FAD-binding oxidoreductase [Elusimicrobiota bacterium]